MHRISTCLGALGSAVLLVLACSGEGAGPLFPRDAGLIGGSGGSGGSRSGGSGGSGGGGGSSAGTGGGGGQAGSEMPALDGGVDATGGDAGCRADADCDDSNACTTDSCESGTCGHGLAVAGAPCGSTTNAECTNPDQCSGGACLPSDEPNGAACSDGSCARGECVAGQPVGCPMDIANTVPLSLDWSSVGRPDLYEGGCDSINTPDYALVFTAPEAGTFRFTATGLVDSTPYTGADMSGTPAAPPDGDAVLTIAPGSCAGVGAVQIECNDDGPPDDDSTDPQLDLVLTDQQVITVYLNELTQTGGGTGTLSVTLLE